MLWFRRCWIVVVCVYVVVGYALAEALLPSAAVICTGIVGFLFAAVVGATAHAHIHQDADVPIPLRALLLGSAITAFGLIATIGMAGLLGIVALLFTLVLMALWPPQLRRLAVQCVLDRTLDATEVKRPRPSWLAAAGPEEPAPDIHGLDLSRHYPSGSMLLPHPMVCARLSAEQLCWWWRASFTALERCVGESQRLSVVRTRQAVLDQLAERNPAGFARWLASGARAGSDPERYFTS